MFFTSLTSRQDDNSICTKYSKRTAFKKKDYAEHTRSIGEIEDFFSSEHSAFSTRRGEKTQIKENQNNSDRVLNVSNGVDSGNFRDSDYPPDSIQNINKSNNNNFWNVRNDSASIHNATTTTTTKDNNNNEAFSYTHNGLTVCTDSQSLSRQSGGQYSTNVAHSISLANIDFFDSLSYEQVQQIQNACAFVEPHLSSAVDDQAFDLSSIRTPTGTSSFILDVDSHISSSRILRDMRLSNEHRRNSADTSKIDLPGESAIANANFVHNVTTPNCSVISATDAGAYVNYMCTPPATHLGSPPRATYSQRSNVAATPKSTPKKQNSWQLTDFEIGPKLGQGKFGKIYLAREKETKFGVVLKCISKEMILYNDLITQVQREIQLQSYLGRHCENVLKLFAYFWDNETIYLVLEYANSGNLLEHIERSPKHRLAEEETQRIARDVLTALEFMHRYQIYHRDIKPENILLLKSGCAKLADFSWCVRASTHKQRRLTMCGTLDYLSPEQVEEKGTTAASDMWSFGVTCYEMMCGYLPFGDDSPAETCARIAKGTYAFPEFLSNEAKHFLSRLLTVNENDRLTAYDALRHPFITSKSFNEDSVSVSSISSFNSFFKTDVFMDVPVKQKNSQESSQKTDSFSVEKGSGRRSSSKSSYSGSDRSNVAAEDRRRKALYSTGMEDTAVLGVMHCSSLPKFSSVNSLSATTGAKNQKQSSFSTVCTDISISTNSFTFSPSAIYSQKRKAPCSPLGSSTFHISELTVASYGGKSTNNDHTNNTGMEGDSPELSPVSPSPLQLNTQPTIAFRSFACGGAEGKGSVSSSQSAGISKSGTKKSYSESQEMCSLLHSKTPQIIFSSPSNMAEIRESDTLVKKGLAIEREAEPCALRLRFEEVVSDTESNLTYSDGNKCTNSSQSSGSLNVSPVPFGV